MKINRKSWIIGSVIIITLVTGGWLFYQQQKTAATLNNQNFDLIKIRRMDLSEKVDASGAVVMEKSAAIYPPYNATVKQILVNPGVQVHKGDILLVLQLKDADLIDYLAGWKSSLDQAKMNLAIAQKSLERQTVLYEVQGTTIDEVENAQSKVRQYQMQVDEFLFKLDSLTKNGVDNQNNVLIRAPFDAEISWIDVKLEEAVSTSSQLLTLGGASAVRVEATVDQGDIDLIKQGLAATITANDQNRTIIPGAVVSFGSTGTISSNVVGFPVVIKPTGSPKILGNLLKAGMTVDVTMMLNSHANVLAVPLRAVRERDGRALVRVFKNGKLERRLVNLGYRNLDYIEVVSGLVEGDQVAIFKESSDQPDSARVRRTESDRVIRRGTMFPGM